ncbi:MAG TPA: hypothetical protein VFU00_13065 [Gemmatimonadales bacterium]|nr:hypothetical protein [Gemmatimonadales bacterium]
MRIPSSLFTALITAGALAVASCGGEAENGDRPEAEGEAPAAAAPAAGEPTSFDGADVDAFARGLTRESELVRAAQEKARTATTADERGAAMQAQWEDQTIPGGAEAAGMSVERYRAVRETITRTLRNLDFQGKIEGPMQLDTARATPEMRRMLETDPYAELPPASAEALRTRIDQLVPIWGAYMELTAVGG